MHKIAIAAALFLAAAIPSFAADGCPVPWGYGANNGPATWGQYSAICASGFSQSPVKINNLLPSPATNLPTLVFQGGPSKFRVKNNQHDLEVYPENQWTLQPFGAKLTKFHFHVPAEHLDGDRRHDAEAHFVYELGDRIFAIAVWIDRVPNPPGNIALQKIGGVPRPGLCQMSPLSTMTIDIQDFLPNRTHYAAYHGSLTTPPCSENVTFFIMLDPIKTTTTVINALTLVAVPPGNSRPVQQTKWRR
jgi:carbonic anhydrase